MMFELGLISKRPRICLAQAEKANPLYRAYKQGWDSFEPMTAGDTEASAIRIGNPVSVRRAIRALEAFDGVVEQASESELAEASASADRAGSYTCPHTGVALAALEKLRAKGMVEPGQRAVVISTANGLKFTQFKIRYHENEIPGVESKHPNRPVELPSEFEAVKASVFRELDKRAK
jgi:threonine synthase